MQACLDVLEKVGVNVRGDDITPVTDYLYKKVILINQLLSNW